MRSRASNDPEFRSRTITAAATETDRMSTLVRNLLLLARGELPQAPSERAVMQIRSTRIHSDPFCTLGLDIAEDPPSAHITADISRLPTTQ